MKKILHYNVIFRQEEEGFTVIVPSLPGCVTYGKNLEEAKIMARDAIIGYIESLRKHNEEVPSDADDFVATMDIEIGKQSIKKLAYA